MDQLQLFTHSSHSNMGQNTLSEPFHSDFSDPASGFNPFLYLGDYSSGTQYDQLLGDGMQTDVNQSELYYVDFTQNPAAPMLSGGPMASDFESHLLSMAGDPNMTFDTSNALIQCPSPPQLESGSGSSQYAGTCSGGSGGPHMSPNSSPYPSHPCSRQHSMAKLATVNQLRASHPSGGSSSTSVLLAEDYAIADSFDWWSAFRCNPPDPMKACPKTANFYLQGLKQDAKKHVSLTETAVWGVRPNKAYDEHSVTAKLSDDTRERLLAITHSFFRKAFELHFNLSDSSMMHDVSKTFVTLPSSSVMEYYLRIYFARFERYYPTVCAADLRPNDLMKRNDSGSPSLLLLLMIALGSMCTATAQARYLSGGLTEACRTSLADIFERDTSRQTECFTPALLFTVLAAWSGDRWHMDLAIAQRGFYLCTLGQRGMFQAREYSLSSLGGSVGAEQSWASWKEHESRNRLVYSWVKVDLEFSIFHDSMPMIPGSELLAQMPDADVLAQAGSAQEWRRSFHKLYPAGKSTVLSLAQMFQSLIGDDCIRQATQLSPSHMTLLLHPLQTLVHNLRQFLTAFSDHNSSGRTSWAITKSRVHVRLEEVQALLSQWHAISEQQSTKASGSVASQEHDELLVTAKLILFHLTYLKTITNFPEIEQGALDDQALCAIWSRSYGVEEPAEAWFHCGRTLRLLRNLPSHIRPPWWAGAVYRVAMIGWAIAMTHGHATSSRLAPLRPPNARFSLESDTDEPTSTMLAIDSLGPDFERMKTYGNNSTATPVLTRANGEFVTLKDPQGVLEVCIELLEDDEMRFAAAIRLKLIHLGERWSQRG